MMFPRLASLVLVFIITACASPSPAPVERRPPSPVKPAAAATVPTPPAADPTPRPEFYTVRPGDTAFGIATANGLTLAQLTAMNTLIDPARLQPGQVLRVRPAPAAAVTGGPSSPAAESVQIGQVSAAGSIESRPLDAVTSAKPLPEPPRAAVEGSRPGAITPPRAAGSARSVVTEPRAFKLPYSQENLAQIQRGDGVASGLRGTTGVEPTKPVADVPKPPSARPEPLKPEAAKPEAAKPEAAKPEAAKPEAPKAAERPRPDADDRDRVDWIWPAKGRVIEKFEGNNKGVDIAGQIGEPVVAAAAGRVVYAGSGLRGYGQLVIIKHNETYLSAYAHNSKLLVKEGQAVARGQRIAEIGQSDADRPKLHFEIRREGRPVDPLGFLPER